MSGTKLVVDQEELDACAKAVAAHTCCKRFSAACRERHSRQGLASLEPATFDSGLGSSPLRRCILRPYRPFHPFAAHHVCFRHLL